MFTDNVIGAVVPRSTAVGCAFTLTFVIRITRELPLPGSAHGRVNRIEFGETRAP